MARDDYDPRHEQDDVTSDTLRAPEEHGTPASGWATPPTPANPHEDRFISRGVIPGASNLLGQSAVGGDVPAQYTAQGDGNVRRDDPYCGKPRDAGAPEERFVG